MGPRVLFENQQLGAIFLNLPSYRREDQTNTGMAGPQSSSRTPVAISRPSTRDTDLPFVGDGRGQGMESIPVRLGSKRSYFLATWGNVVWSLGCGVVVKRLCSRMVSGSQLIQCSDALRSKLKELGRNGSLPVCSKFCRASQIESFNFDRESARVGCNWSNVPHEGLDHHHAGLSIPTRIRRSRKIAWRPPIKWPALAGITSIAPHLQQRRRALNAKTIHRRR